MKRSLKTNINGEKIYTQIYSIHTDIEKEPKWQWWWLNKKKEMDIFFTLESLSTSEEKVGLDNNKYDTSEN